MITEYKKCNECNEPMKEKMNDYYFDIETKCKIEGKVEIRIRVTAPRNHDDYVCLKCAKSIIIKNLENITRGNVIINKCRNSCTGSNNSGERSLLW